MISTPVEILPRLTPPVSSTRTQGFIGHGERAQPCRVAGLPRARQTLPGARKSMPRDSTDLPGGRCEMTTGPKKMTRR